MSEHHCHCYLLDGTVQHGTLLELNHRERLAKLSCNGERQSIPFTSISHLYHNRSHPAQQLRTFMLHFNSGSQLHSHCMGTIEDKLGHHLHHVGSPTTSIHLFIPTESPHQLTFGASEPFSTPTASASTESVVEQVAALFQQAIRERASDIHLRPLKEKVEVKFRIDGEMETVQQLDPAQYPALVSHIKILANMDIAEHRKPQDGAYRLQFEGRDVDLRISTVVVVEGESVAIRILDPKSGLRTLSEIGFRDSDEQLLLELLQQKGGLILVTGPTGSGKSTTLYAAMRALREQQLNIISLEDPVEYRIDQVRQIEINEAAGSTFPKNLRHILRHDPDVILIGEIRDEETAHIALQSAYTGHLVLSTLHTGDAPSAIPRLLEMGIEPYTLKDTLLGVLSQRLVRSTCPHCHGQPEAVTSCHHCHQSGYHGRVPLYELMPADESLRDLIRSGITAQEIRTHALSDGMIPIEQHARMLVQQQSTQPEEITRKEITHKEITHHETP